MANKPLVGVTDAFSETGTEGIVWSFFDLAYENPETKMRSYEGLHTLSNGDILIFSDRTIIVDLEYETNWQPYPAFKHLGLDECHRKGLGQQMVNNLWVHGVQRDMSAEEWASLFINPVTCQLIKKD